MRTAFHVLCILNMFLVLAFVMSGCASYDTFKEGVKVKGADAADEADRVAIWEICKSGSRGALVRGWMDTQEHFDLWVGLCLERSNIDPQIVTEPE